jgi:hypothetical protein
MMVRKPVPLQASHLISSGTNFSGPIDGRETEAATVHLSGSAKMLCRGNSRTAEDKSAFYQNVTHISCMEFQ